MKSKSSMTDFGKFTFTYTPPETNFYDEVEPTITMSISSEADLTEMNEMFSTFLKANGYLDEEDLSSLTASQQNTKDWSDFWGDDVITFGGNRNLISRSGNDVLSFG